MKKSELKQLIREVIQEQEDEKSNFDFNDELISKAMQKPKKDGSQYAWFTKFKTLNQKEKDQILQVANEIQNSEFMVTKFVNGKRTSHDFTGITYFKTKIDAENFAKSNTKKAFSGSLVDVDYFIDKNPLFKNN